MPAIACVVEVDDGQPVAVDDDVARMHVGVDQAVGVRLPAQAAQQVVHALPDIEEKAPLGGRERPMLPELTPMRRHPHQPIAIERVALEPRWRLPGAGLHVHRRGDGAELLEGLFDTRLVGGLGQHVGEKAAFRPARQAGEALLAGGGDRHRHIVLSVARHHGVGNVDAGLGERPDPRPLGNQLLERVIARPVQAEDVRPAVPAVGHPERHVLGERDQGQVLRVDRKGLQGGVGGGRECPVDGFVVHRGLSRRLPPSWHRRR